MRGMLVALLLVSFGVVDARAPRRVAVAPTGEFSAAGRLAGAVVPVTMNFEGVQLSKVLVALGAAGGFKVVLNGDFRATPVTLQLDDLTIGNALTQLANDYDLVYDAPSSRLLIVKPR